MWNPRSWANMFQFLEDSIIRSFYLLGAESARDDNSVGDNKVFRVTATKCSLTVISLTVKQGELCRRQACLKFPTKSQNNPHALAVMMYNNIYILPLGEISRRHKIEKGLRAVSDESIFWGLLDCRVRLYLWGFKQGFYWNLLLCFNSIEHMLVFFKGSVLEGLPTST